MVNFVYLFYTIVKGFYLSKLLSVTSTIEYMYRSIAVFRKTKLTIKFMTTLIALIRMTVHCMNVDM